jgi:hypothetical protein
MTLKANLIAAALLTAAIAAPTAQATDDGTLISQASRTASATAPDIRQTDPRAAGPFITDTLGGNGHPAAAKGYRIITDTLGGNGVRRASPGGVLDAVKRSSPNQVGLAWQYLRDTGQIATSASPNKPEPTHASQGSSLGVPREHLATEQVTTVSNGFAWADAGIGAAFVAGLATIAIGAWMLVRRRHGLAQLGV